MARRGGRAAVSPTGVARPLHGSGPITAPRRLTPLGLARPRLVGRPIGAIGPAPDIGPIRMIPTAGMVGPIPDVGPIAVMGPISVIGPISVVGATGPLAHRERRRAHRNGARVRARKSTRLNSSHRYNSHAGF